MASHRSLVESIFRLALHDINLGHGKCEATLRSGTVLVGNPDTKLTDDDVLHLKTRDGWITIDWAEVVAIRGYAREQ